MRFVRVMPSEDPKLLGERLRIEREAPGELCDLVDETVWPEQAHNVDANRRKITERLMLTDAQQIWLRDCLIEMHGGGLVLTDEEVTTAKTLRSTLDEFKFLPEIPRAVALLDRLLTTVKP